MKKVTAILTGDWHLRDSVPSCRTDDFIQTQWNKLEFISNLQKEHECPILHSGDLFEYWKPSPWLLSQVLERLPNDFRTIYGNHDLPQHSYALHEKSGVHTLMKANRLTVLPNTHWGNAPEYMNLEGRKILIWHIMTYRGKAPFPGCTDIPAGGILRKHKVDLILTGHNHQSFVEEYEGRTLVNPGSITRQESNQNKHIPTVYLYHASDNSVTPIIIPHANNVVQKAESIQTIEERNERIDAFISKINEDWDSTLNFETNLERYISVNKTPKAVVDILYKHILP